MALKAPLNVSISAFCLHTQCKPDIAGITFHDVESVKKYLKESRAIHARPCFVQDVSVPCTTWADVTAGNLVFDGEHLLCTNYDLAIDDWSPEVQLLQPVSMRNSVQIGVSCATRQQRGVRVKTLTGKELLYLVDESARAHTLKQMIFEQEGIPPDQIRLITAGGHGEGRQLEHSELICKSVLSRNEIMTVYLVLRLRGGMHHPTSGHKDFCSYSDLDHQTMSRVLDIAYTHPLTKTKEKLKVHCGSMCEPQTVIDFLRMETDATYFKQIPVEKLREIALSPWSDLLSRDSLRRLTRAIALGSD